MKSILSVILLFAFCSPVQASLFVRNGQRKEVQTSQTKQASDGYGLRKTRRVGVGVSGAGPLGLAGANLELNITPKWSLMAGYGTGVHYQSYTFQAKRVLAGEYLLPYMAAGVSRWYTTAPGHGKIDNIQPAFLDRFMSADEKASGEFSELLLYPAFGLQYVQLDGSWAGYSMFVEVLLLLDIEEFETAPTATVGFLYYF
ncbi:MAG: hypothetical protein AB7F59_14295 [Bdellovibrionales bacterium]